MDDKLFVEARCIVNGCSPKLVCDFGFKRLVTASFPNTGIAIETGKSWALDWRFTIVGVVDGKLCTLLAAATAASAAEL